MGEIYYVRTDGSNSDFAEFYRITEEFYSSLVGGKKNRQGFVPFNASSEIPDVIIAYDGDKAVACAGLKKYSDNSTEIKRVWVQPEYRRRHIAAELMDIIEQTAREQGFERIILQTRPQMTQAVKMYENRGYTVIPNYPPYDRLEGAVCYAKQL